MTSAAPTVLTFEANSAWILILAVSTVTLCAALLLRKILARPGGMSSGLLLLLPLALPLVAASLYQSGVLPEISVLKPAGLGLSESSDALLRLFRVTDTDSGTSAFYVISGSPGSWLVVVGLGVTAFMLARRALGTLLVRRAVARCTPIDDPRVMETVETLAARAGLARTPVAVCLPEGVSGAFVTGVRRPQILISKDLLQTCDEGELEGILAHEIAHLAARDVPLTSISGLLRDLVAWNPVAHLAHRRLCIDREYEADRRAAVLTGDPLAVASGLLRAVEVMKGRDRLAQRAVLAFLRPGALVAKRVNGLLAVADGRSDVTPAGHLPFAVAGVLVALVGLQVGDRIANQDSGLAIVWGDPTRSEGTIWKAPPAPPKGKAQGRGAASKSATKPKGRSDLKKPIRLLGLSEVVRVKESDLELWMGMVDRRVARAGLQAATVRWEARRQYQAVPLISTLPIGIYRIDREF